MKTSNILRQLKGFAMVALMPFVLLNTSCNKEEVEPVNTHEDAYGDVLLKKMNMMGQDKYVPVFFAGGEDIVGGESTVTAPDGTVYPLNEFWAGPGILTANGQVNNTFDFAGEYRFKLKFADGYLKEVTDILENTELDVPQISVNYDQAAQTIEVSWTDVPGADLYCLKITELDMANTKPLFKKAQLPTNITSYTIHIDGGDGWMRPVSDLQTGTEYWVVIAAKKVEQGKPVSGMSHDFQTSSCNKTKIVY